MFFRNDDKKDGNKKTRTVPLLPLRDIIVFPHMVVPLFVGREKSIAALEEAMSKDKDILLCAQKKAKTNEPTAEDIFAIGTLGTIHQLLRLPDGTVKVLVEGKKRARVRKFVTSETYFLAECEEIEELVERSVELEALVRSVHAVFDEYVKLNKRIPPEMLMSVATIDDPARLADTIVAHLSLKLNDKQEILEIESPAKRLEKLYELMQGEIEILQVEKKIRTRVKKQMEKTQKEYYLNEQMQAIQKELGERDEFKNEIQELEERIKAKKMSKEALIKVKKEIKKLRMMQPMSAEATVVRNYIDWILSLPWQDYTKDALDITKAEEILNEDHYGLTKPKERILEYLAVQTLVEKLKGPILCFVGPPGVGKTSLAKSIARCTGRKYVRISLGGVRDEAEIRGHRRTYIGALPGKIIQSLKKAGSGNPVILLDEIDKMSTDFRGDPSAALLEVLDPEQNHSFNDHYLDLDYDLSKVMFICTANGYDGIPLPLYDRMEVIEVSSYTDLEKLAIAQRYLVPKELEANGLKDVKVVFSRQALLLTIHRYTREAGVRSLEREIASLCRKVAKRVLKEGKEKTFKVTSKKVMKYLGPPKFEYGSAEKKDQIGLVNGLVWTRVGGDTLPIEVATMPGKGKLMLTGKLGEVMKESAQAAMSYVRSRADRFGIDHKQFENLDIHMHFPETAQAKDGPSAGLGMTLALVSALTKIPVKQGIAITGEINLRGSAMTIGGLKEKTIAAHRAGIKTVIIPKGNEKHIKDIPKKVRAELKIVPVEHMDEVIKIALQLEDPEKFFKDLPTPAPAATQPAATVDAPAQGQA
ncbi:MAG: endopeptidase La [Deltaproteobacteria bacterium]|nr:endopeptidase La [Deltaproteobacteria bacterium]